MRRFIISINEEIFQLLDCYVLPRRKNLHANFQLPFIVSKLNFIGLVMISLESSSFYRYRMVYYLIAQSECASLRMTAIGGSIGLQLSLLKVH